MQQHVIAAFMRASKLKTNGVRGLGTRQRRRGHPFLALSRFGVAVLADARVVTWPHTNDRFEFTEEDEA